MPRRGENIYKRRDGRWEGRILIDRIYHSVYAHSYSEVKQKLRSYSVKPMNDKQKERNTVSDYATQWLAYLDFVNGYCNLYYSETDISHDSFLSLLLSNGLLVVNRIQMSTNDMNNTELKNSHKYDLITDYWADNYGDNDNDEDDYDDDE